MGNAPGLEGMGPTWPTVASLLDRLPVACCKWRARPLAVGNAVSMRTSTSSRAAACFETNLHFCRSWNTLT